MKKGTTILFLTILLIVFGCVAFYSFQLYRSQFLIDYYGIEIAKGGGQNFLYWLSYVPQTIVNIILGLCAYFLSKRYAVSKKAIIFAYCLVFLGLLFAYIPLFGQTVSPGYYNFLVFTDHLVVAAGPLYVLVAILFLPYLACIIRDLDVLKCFTCFDDTSKKAFPFFFSQLLLILPLYVTEELESFFVFGIVSTLVILFTLWKEQAHKTYIGIISVILLIVSLVLFNSPRFGYIVKRIDYCYSWLPEKSEYFCNRDDFIAVAQSAGLTGRGRQNGQVTKDTYSSHSGLRVVDTTAIREERGPLVVVAIYGIIFYMLCLLYKEIIRNFKKGSGDQLLLSLITLVFVYLLLHLATNFDLPFPSLYYPLPFVSTGHSLSWPLFIARGIVLGIFSKQRSL